jgi:ABC-type nitrate/sulfonate/bicarbonate transport system permease component
VGTTAGGESGRARPIARRRGGRTAAITRARARRPRLTSWVLRIVSILFVFVLWEWAGRIPVSVAFPTFSATMLAFAEMVADGTFAAAYAETIGPLLVGVLLTGLGGILAGLVMGLSPKAEWLGLPLVIVLQASPSAAIVPLITFVYGIGFAAKVFAVVLLSAPVIVLNSYRGIHNTPRSLLEMSDAFLANRWQRIWKIVLPAASGLIFAGLRLGLAQGFTGAVLAELIITPTGIGDLITFYRSGADYAYMFASIFSIVLFASVSLTLLQRLEQRIFRPEMMPT